MESTHYRTGEKALLSYNVSKAKELSDPGDFNSTPTGNTYFILTEIYETMAGVHDHRKQPLRTCAFQEERSAGLDSTECYTALFSVSFAFDRKRRLRLLTGGPATDARKTSGHSNLTGSTPDRISFGSVSVYWQQPRNPSQNKESEPSSMVV